MKIRFTTPRQAAHIDQGTRVNYAEPKRHAYRLRWYLILLVVASPLLYFAWQAAATLWKIEAPGYVELPTFNVIAPQSAMVERVLVTRDAQVTPGQPLLQLHRGEIDARIATLRTRLEAPAANPTTPASAQEQAWLSDAVARYQRLFDAGAATRAELDEARARLAAAQPTARPLSAAERQERSGWQSELAELESLKQALLLRAPVKGTVVRLETHDGLNVQAGQPLLSLQENTTARISALLPSRHAQYARAGQHATVSWPSGDKVPAVVLYDGIIAERVPEVLRRFGDAGQGILVQLQLTRPIPPALQVNNVAVSVSFHRKLPSF